MSVREAYMTFTGRAWHATAVSGGTVAPISHMAFGTSQAPILRSETALRAETDRFAISSKTVNASQGTTDIAAYIPATHRTIRAHEVGLFASDGKLIAIGRFEQELYIAGPDAGGDDEWVTITILIADVSDVLVTVESQVAVPTGRKLKGQEGIVLRNGDSGDFGAEATLASDVTLSLFLHGLPRLPGDVDEDDLVLVERRGTVSSTSFGHIAGDRLDDLEASQFANIVLNANRAAQQARQEVRARLNRHWLAGLDDALATLDEGNKLP